MQGVRWHRLRRRRTRKPRAAFDLDHCLDPATGQSGPWALEIVAPASSYTELSPTGQGCARVGESSMTISPRSASTSKRAMAISTSKFSSRWRGRYLTVTGRPYGELQPLAMISDTLRHLSLSLRRTPERQRCRAGILRSGCRACMGSEGHPRSDLQWRASRRRPLG